MTTNKQEQIMNEYQYYTRVLTFITSALFFMSLVLISYLINATY
ncbi:MAG: hypothetical protein ABI441_15490 [Flavobacterium sp.]